MSYFASRPEQSTTAEAALLTQLNNLAASSSTQAIQKNANGTFSNVSINQAIVSIGSSISSGTAGSVLFVDQSGLLGQSNSQFFWDNTNNRLGIGTNSPTTSLTIGINSSPVGVSLYNTLDQTTNFELGRLSWTSNVFTLSASKGGTGTGRNLSVTAGTGQLILTGATTSVLTISGSGPVFAFSRNNTSVTSLVGITSNGLSASSGSQTALLVNPTISQSSTAGYNAIQVNVTESALGSGVANLLDLQVASSSKFTVADTGKAIAYAGVTSAGWGIPAVYASARSTGQTAAVSSVATYTCGASDGSFIISGNINVTASTTHSIALQVTYTDETNTSRTLTLNTTSIAGSFLTAITNVQGVGAYEGVPLHVRVKASTAITILTSGTFTSVTYNVEGLIMQVA